MPTNALAAAASRNVERAWNAAFIGDDAPFDIRQFCLAHGVTLPPSRTSYNWCDGSTCPPSWATAAAFRWMLPRNGVAALEFLSAAMGLRALGVEAVRLPSARPGEGITEDTMDLTAALGALVATVAKARSDGTYDHVDAAEIERDARPVLRELLELHADAASVPQPQMRLEAR